MRKPTQRPPPPPPPPPDSCPASSSLPCWIHWPGWGAVSFQVHCSGPCPPVGADSSALLRFCHATKQRFKSRSPSGGRAPSIRVSPPLCFVCSSRLECLDAVVHVSCCVAPALFQPCPAWVQHCCCNKLMTRCWCDNAVGCRWSVTLRQWRRTALQPWSSTARLKGFWTPPPPCRL